MDMVKDIHLRILPQVAFVRQSLLKESAGRAKVPVDEVTDILVRRQSIDARRHPVMVDMEVRIFVSQEPSLPYEKTEYKDVRNCKRVIVVGEGPAGLFCALRLLEQGLCPIVLERGEQVHGRKISIAKMIRSNHVDENSNFCFGEGGAGTFSDGKLYTRSKKRGNVDKVLFQFCQHGADPAILGQSHPHLGTDKLPRIIEHMRNTIIEYGGEVHFNTEVVGLKETDGRVCGALCRDGSTFDGPIVLATGHSAESVYRFLKDGSYDLEAKGIAIGVRVEHPQQLIDRIQYKDPKGRGSYLPAAEYSFVTQVQGRGVYSFCMCPGGLVIPSHTEQGRTVVNGMSPASRTGRWANSAMVVELHPEDMPVQFQGALGMLSFQKAMEMRTWKVFDKGLVVPAQRMTDFCAGKMSNDLPETSYVPGVASADLRTLFPSFVSMRLKLAFEQFGQKARGFLTDEALLLACESRTSSPVRIVRDDVSLMSKDGLFPCGEGAGYAGGIVSSAMDGINVADAVVRYLA
jgi:uncharacterized FAD-dependent dehydrogenase